MKRVLAEQIEEKKQRQREEKMKLEEYEAKLEASISKANSVQENCVQVKPVQDSIKESALEEVEQAPNQEKEQEVNDERDKREGREEREGIGEKGEEERPNLEVLKQQIQVRLLKHGRCCMRRIRSCWKNWRAERSSWCSISREESPTTTK
eukprot:TRINITY_DN9796_c0_g2_i1.p3 TRINITY_DN9796_c0_g2~~TRINITY_DN9796_c0_g2_i1.p3  ORF type:complete len:151 (+),score=51.82 TRINITY_DN9796_c0_g2_i1:756-1208(+)